MPQRITVPMSQVKRITVPMSQIKRSGSTEAAPYQSAVYRGGPETATWGQQAEDMSAEIIRGLGLESPVLAMADLGLELEKLLTGRGRENPAQLQADAAARANRPKQYNGVPTIQPPMPTDVYKGAATVAKGTADVAVKGVQGLNKALYTSAKGARSLAVPEIPAPTTEEFKAGARGVGEFMQAAPLVELPGQALNLARGTVRTAAALPSEMRVFRNARKVSKLTPVQQDAALGSIAATGIKAKGVSPYRIGNESRQGIQQAFNEFGLDPNRTLPTKNRSLTTNEMIIGGTEDDLARVNAVLKQEHDAAVLSGKLPPTAEFIPEESIQLAAADRMVEIYHRPIKNAVDRFAQVKRADVKRKVYNDLMQRSAQESAGNPALSDAFKNAAKQVAQTPDTVEAMYALKVKANKMPSPRYSGTPSQQIASDVTTSTAQAELADSIRQHLYPAIENIGKINGKPMTGELIKAGRREASSIALRDGIYNEWSKAAFGQSTADLESWWHHTIRGHSESVPFFGQGTPFRRASAINAVARGLSGVEKPMAELNELLRKGIGPMDKFVPEQAVITPRMELPALSEVPEPRSPALPQNTWGEIPPPELSRIGGVELNPSRMITSGQKFDLPPQSEPTYGKPGMEVTTGEPLIRGYEDLISIGGKQISKRATAGPAKGMTLTNIELDPLTSQPARYIYTDSQTGRQLVFTAPQ